MTRLGTWIDSEIAIYESEYGPMPQDERERYATHLRGTLNGAQLHAADQAGALGDVVLKALRDHTDRLRNIELARWFRDRA